MIMTRLLTWSSPTSLGHPSYVESLLEVSVRSLPSHQSSLLLCVDSSGERELDLGVVHLGDQRSATLASCDSLTSDDLDGVSSCSMSGTHVSVALGDGAIGRHIPVLSVHVVSARPGVVSQPDTKVLNFEGEFFLDQFTGNNFSGGLLELSQLTQKVPESGLSHNVIRSKNSHPVQRSYRFSIRWQFSTDHGIFLQGTLSLHFSPDHVVAKYQ